MVGTAVVALANKLTRIVWAILTRPVNDEMLRVSGADAWFDKPWADEIPIKEQTVRIYDDEVLALLVVLDERMLAN